MPIWEMVRNANFCIRSRLIANAAILARTLVRSKPASQLSEFRVDKRYELIEGRAIPFSPCDQQLGDLHRRSGTRGAG